MNKGLNKKIYIINGSPRKNWNTDKMCKSFAQGTLSRGIESEIVYLYDIDFKGCISCLSCKLKNSKTYGKCSHQDGLTPILEKVSNADGLVVASPVYFFNVSSATRAFTERFIFPFAEYKKGYPSCSPKKFPVTLILTMNMAEEKGEATYRDFIIRFRWIFDKAFMKTDLVVAWDTCQFSDYSKYVCDIFDGEHKKQRLVEQLPKDLENAYNAGVKMADKIISFNK